jgi:hypothetical protein
MDVAQELEDVLEALAGILKDVNRLKTASVSGKALRKQVKDAHKRWLPIAGVLETGDVVDVAKVQVVQDDWTALVKLANGANPKKQYKPLLRSIIAKTEADLLHTFIKGSAIQTIGDALRRRVQPVTDPDLLTYVDESIRCAERSCVRASVVLAWCAVAHKIHRKLASLGVATLNAEFARMKNDKGLMFRTFTRDYTLSSEADIQEVADAHLILLCRFRTLLDDTEYKHLKGALELRNGCGHPTGYHPDPVKLQAFYADIVQLVLLNPTFA